MNRIVRFTSLIALVALSLACSPRAGHAGTAGKPAKTCYFVRNHLPCPCPGSRQARAVIHAAGVTVGAVGSAIGTTAVALNQAERSRARKTTESPKR
jgi:hypothetical protein